MEDSEIENIVFAGVIFAVWMFIAVAFYYFLSVPILQILTGIQNIPSTDLVANALNEHVPNISWGVNVAFSLSMATPIAWFIFWVFSREPYVGRRRM